MEIENAVFMSEEVRTSLEKLREWDPKADISDYDLHLDIKKLNHLIEEDNNSKTADHPQDDDNEGHSLPNTIQLSLFEPKTSGAFTAQMKQLSSHLLRPAFA